MAAAAAAILIGVLLAMAALDQPLAKAAFNSEGSAVEKDKPVNTDARIVAAMKTSMYDQVADDEDIDIMAAWIKAGAKNDDTFKQDIYPIIKNDCVNYTVFLSISSYFGFFENGYYKNSPPIFQ